MICTTTMLSAALLAALPTDASEMRTEAAKTLRAEAARTHEGDDLDHWLAAARATIAAAGDGPLADALESSVLDARWRATVDPASAAEHLERELRQLLGDLEFEPSIDAGLPAGFPSPTPVRHIELKRYPAYRFAYVPMQEDATTDAFWTLFRHIESKGIPMTAPVETSYASDGPEARSMAFLYATPDLGEAGTTDHVEVRDVPAATVASLGGRGELSGARVDEARALLLSWIASRDDIEPAGPLRSMSYSGPRVPASERYFEIQIPVTMRAVEPEALIDFGDHREAQRWQRVNDGVMGGLSRSRLVAENSIAVFEGSVSLENGGGFASVRRSPEDLKLKRSSALRLRVRGDGKTYKLRLRTTEARDGVNYEARFTTTADEWQTHLFSAGAFRAVWRGRAVPDAPRLAMPDVRSLGVMISDKQSGSFRLELASVSDVLPH